MSAQWYACEQPERPTDAFVVWHYGICRGCEFKADVLAHLHPDDPHVAWLVRMVEVPA